MAGKKKSRKKQPANKSATPAVGSLDQKKKDAKFVIGVDFGTTYTSVVFAHSESPNGTKIVQSWPGGTIGNNSADQVPSKVEYTDPKMTWGYEVDEGAETPDSKPLKWFKLLLQDQDGPLSASKNRVRSFWPLLPRGGSDTTLSEVSGRLGRLGISPPVTPEQETRKILNQLNIKPVKLIADFLEQIRETTLESMNRTYQMTEEVDPKIEWILTVPAIWNDGAKNAMIQAATMAGFGEWGVDFELISEPECAATYSLSELQPKPGEVFVVCDAGGGTVDLISYKIAGNKPLRVDEVVPCSGALCGSVFLDRRFEAYMRKTFGDKFITDMMRWPKSKMMASWEETIKLKFGNGFQLGGYDVHAPGASDDKDLNVKFGYHKMKATDVQAIFDPVVDQIISLVSEQVSKVTEQGEKVKAIILVGGFGSSEYLRKRLSSHTYGDRKIDVLQPVNARTAIARGALLRGVDGSIIMTRRAPRHYGTAYEQFYGCGHGISPDAKKHVYRSDSLEALMIPGRMDWFIKKGTAIKPALSSFSWIVRIQPRQEPDFLFMSSLYSYELDGAPEYRWQKPTAIKRVCTLVADLSSIPRSKFETFTNSSGEKFWRIKCEHQMKLVNEVWVFELMYEGKTYGTVETKYMSPAEAAEEEEEEDEGEDGDEGEEEDGEDQWEDGW